MAEKNNKNLQEILEKMAQYDAPDNVWASIEQRLPLLELKNYDAPDNVWDNIAHKLTLSQLPQHDAPNFVWDNIEKTLQTNVVEKETKTVFLFKNKRQILGVAASIALLICVGFAIFKVLHLTENNIQISTEVVDNQLFKNEIEKSINNDEASFAIVAEFCKTATYVCEKPEFKSLASELNELNTAREEIKVAISEYNTNADLVEELTKIENERSKVLQQIVEITTSIND